jgi:spore coat protein H
MLRCQLDLGEDPWAHLAEGRVIGRIRWNGGEWLEAAARIRGAHSRRFPRKSLQVDMGARRLADEPPAGHSVRRIHLNADFIDPTLMRSALSYQLFEQVGAPAPLCRHAFVTISGGHAGLYVALESVDRDFCRRRGWEPGAIFYAVNRNANFALTSPTTQSLKQPLDLGYRTVHGADTAPLRRMLMDINLASDRGFAAAAERWIDVDGYLRWLMVAVFVGNRDGFMHNYALCRAPETGRFRVIPWDYDATWGIDINGRPARLDRVPLVGWNQLSKRLLSNAQYRRRYQQLFLAALDGPLSPAAIDPMIDKMSTDLLPWLDKDPLRSVDKNRFPGEVKALNGWARDRRNQLLSELAAL